MGETLEIKPELQKESTWTEKFKKTLTIQILNLKSQPKLFKQFLEYKMQLEVDDGNIIFVTEQLLLHINSCKIVELADIMAYIAYIQNEKYKQASLEKN